MSRALLFDFYGVLVRVSIESTPLADFLVEQLEEDFSFFQSKQETETAHIHILIAEKNIEFNTTIRPWFQTPLCQAWQVGSKRYCRFQDASLLVDTGSATREARLNLKSSERGYEALYYYLLSTVGEALDRKGLHRMHAVAFEEVGGAICLPLDSKKGKTTRAMKILKEKGKRIFGDEVILTDGNLIYPFPIRLAVRPEVYTDFSEIKAQAFTRSLGGLKFLVPIPKEQIASATTNFTLRLSFDERFPLLRFYAVFLLGLGLPQMREFMVRPNSLGSLLIIFYKRVVCLFRLNRKIVVSSFIDKNSP